MNVMAPARKSSSSLHIEGCDLYIADSAQNILFAPFHLYDYHITAKCKTEELLLNKIFTKF